MTEIPMQDELRFDDARAWDRQVREKSHQHAAFLIYLNLGPNRTLAQAYRQWRAERQSQPNLIEASSPSAAWKRWFKCHKWEQRAAAWDDWKRCEQDRAEREVEEQLWEKKVERRRALDEIKFQRIMSMNAQIDEILRSPTGLTRSRQTSEVEGKQVMVEVDRPRQFEVLSEKLDTLEDRYFDRAGSAQEGQNAAEGEQGVPVIGEFRWVPDPEMAGENSADDPPKPDHSEADN